MTTLLIVLIPLFVPQILVAFTLQEQSTVVLNNWFVTFVDEKQSGKCIAKRQTFVLAVMELLVPLRCCPFLLFVVYIFLFYLMLSIVDSFTVVYMMRYLGLYLCIPTAFLFAAVANAGFAVSVFNRRYELMPHEGRILYDNFYSAAVGLAFILGPVIGGGIKQGLESVNTLESMMHLGNIRLLYVISAVGIILLQLLFTTRHAKTIKHCLFSLVSGSIGW